MPNNPFTPPSISGYNASPPPDDGSQTSANRVEWAKHTSKLSGPVKTLAEACVTAANTAFSTIAGWFSGTYAHNFIVNGDFRVAQMGTSFTSVTSPANNDDTYLLDQWILLANGTDTVDVSQETATIPTDGYAAIKLDVETANRKFGIFQPIEARNAQRLAGKTVSLSFKARITGTSLTKIRAAVLSWSSTADSITSDIVSSWNAEGTTPTFAANWTAENTAIDLTTPTTSYQTYEIEAIAVDTASMTNVGVFIWCENTTTTVADFLFISDVMLHIGGDALDFQPANFEEEYAKCQRYLWQLNRASGGNTVIASGHCASTTTAEYTFQYPVRMLTAPTFSVSSTTGFLVRSTGAVTTATTNVTAAGIGTETAMVTATVTAGLTGGQGVGLGINADGTWARFAGQL